jgi:hypothetical protein
MQRRAMRVLVVLFSMLGLVAIASVKSQGTPAPPAPAAQIAGTLMLTSDGVHDVSDSLRGLKPQAPTRGPSEVEIERAAGMSVAHEAEERQVAAQPGIPDGDKLTGPLGFATALGDATPITNQNLAHTRRP